MFTQLSIGYRSLRRTPLLWGGIVLTLALALAATVVVFNLVNAYLLRPLPYGDTSRLATVFNASVTVHAGSTTEVDFVQRVTPELFPMIGARAQFGDGITPANAKLDGQRAVVLSNEPGAPNNPRNFPCAHG